MGSVTDERNVEGKEIMSIYIYVYAALLMMHKRLRKPRIPLGLRGKRKLEMMQRDPRFPSE